MGEVLRAVDEGGPQVAIKVPAATSADAAERFEREAQVLASLAHRNVVGYVDRGVLDEGRIYIAMELVEGVDLTARMESPPPLGVAETVTLGARVAEAVGAVHRRLEAARERRRISRPSLAKNAAPAFQPEASPGDTEAVAA